MLIGRWLGSSPNRLLLCALRSSHTASLRWPLPEDAFHGDSPNRFSEQLPKIEEHWKKALQGDGTAKESQSDLPKQYVLSMFPYPSGSLHMGHMRVYTISDVSARYYRLNGYNVIHPIGWDSFGLPAENAARDRGVDPREWTRSNIASMKDQLLRTGVQFDWDREISTCEPEYYRWTQWIFCRLHEKGLLRRNLAEVNWDPVDETVLAAEQIDADGRSWRSGAKAEKRKLRQWMVDTPRYAKRLSDGLRLVSQWHDVADIQSNWIGHCDVYRFMFPLRDSARNAMEELLDLRVHDPLQVGGAYFVVLKQGHPLSDPTRQSTTESYLLSSTVLNGVTGEWMPIVVVPATHDEKEGGGPPMHLNARLGDTTVDASLITQFQLKPSRRVMPMNFDDVQEIASFGGYGGYLTSRSLQDWVVSRQRAWGTPIPMILSEDGRSAVPIDNSRLPLIQGQAGRKERIQCDRLHEGYGYYDTDTLDTFFDSAWYYLRYLDPHNSKQLISKEAAGNMPVDLYVGGVEHAAVHMFFARFISHFLTDIGVTSTAEPFRHLIPQGIVRGKTYVEPETGKYVRNDEVEFKDKKAFSRDGVALDAVFEKMSKSKMNGVDPLMVLDRDGIDLTRLQLLDAAAPRQAINWGDSDLRGLRKWLDRVAWVVSHYVEERTRVVEGAEKQTVDPKLEALLRENYNYFVRNISMCLEVLHLHNTALARIQGLTNALRKVNPAVYGTSVEAERCVYALVTMMQIYAPHASSELWAALQKVPSIGNVTKNEVLSDQPWPQVDADCSIDFILIINGISCGRLSVPRGEIEGLSKEDVIWRARDKEHSELLRKLGEKGLELGQVEMTARNGFHVTLTASLATEVDPKEILNCLDEIQLDRRKAAKAQKKAKHRVVVGK